MFSLFTYINRKDEIVYKFSTGQIIEALDEKSYSEVLDRTNYERTMIDMMKKGERIHTKKRQKVMYLFGGTICLARYPLFIQKVNNPKGQRIYYGLAVRDTKGVWAIPRR